MNDTQNRATSIDMKSLADFNGYTFFVPSQQRGYKWRVRNVLELVNDLLDFQQSGTAVYCMQPLAVVKQNNKYIVLDGQQRLTTLFLIISALGLSPGYGFEFERDNNATDERKHLLANLYALDRPDDTSIDYYYISKAYVALAYLFGNDVVIDGFSEEETEYLRLLKKQLGDSGKSWLKWLLSHNESYRPQNSATAAKKIVFIWYEVDGENAHQVFRNLNSGKIELNNSDLIKALLLSDSSTVQPERRAVVALQFERILLQMKDDRFWHMLQRCEYKRNGYRMTQTVPKAEIGQIIRQNRIDLIFNLIAGVSETDYQNDALASFRYFYDRRHELNTLWEDSYRLFLKLLGLYNGPFTYHYAGFLTFWSESNSYNNIRNWLKWLDERSKKEVTDAFREEIRKWLHCSTESSGNGVTDIVLPDYSDSTALLRRVLLLHNIETILSDYTHKRDSSKLKLESIYEMFPFDLLYRQKWDIEHIASQTDNDIRTKDAQTVWLNTVEADFPAIFDSSVEYVHGFNNDAINEIRRLKDEYDNAVRAGKSFGEIFSKLYRGVISASEDVLGNDRITDKDRLGNLCLLDSHTNRSYHNSLFPSKRRIMIEADGVTPPYSSEAPGTTVAEPAFIPVCTRRVFMKYYNRLAGASLAAWTVKDAEAYEADIKNKLSIYFKAQHNG